MVFKKRAIRKSKPQKDREEKTKTPERKKHLKIKLSLGISFFIIIVLLAGIVKAVSSIDFTIFLKAAGEELKVDAFGHSNFLILGTGGANHDGGDLTDTIIVASLDNEKKLVTMISLPRDTYIKDQEVGNSRINEVYYNAKNHFGSSIEGLNHLKGKVESLLGVPIHYWIKIDFKGFKELIDALDGIDVDVEKAIYDPYYPLDGTYQTQTFKLNAGLQHLDGATALKYARSRKTTSDFDRAKRQQDIIYAIKEKTLQTKTFLSKEKLTNILNTLKNNLETNITVKEILTLGAFAKDFSRDQISHRLIHDNPIDCGGFLYTPVRELYNGMFVLLPAGGFKFVHLYSDLNFNYPEIAHQNTKLHILNGTKTAGVAGEAKQILQRFCFDVVRFGNAEDRELLETTYYYNQNYDEKGNPINKRPEALKFLQKIIPGKESTIIPKPYLEAGYLNEANIIIEIGSNYVDSEGYLEDPFYYLPAAPIKSSPETTEPQTTTPATAATPTN